MRIFVLIPFLAVLFVGCTSVSVSTQGGHETVMVQNSRCSLLGLPLISGDPDYPNLEVGSWFEDTLSLETNLRLLDREVVKRGGRRSAGLHSSRDDEQLLPFLLTRSILTSSAEIVR